MAAYLWLGIEHLVFGIDHVLFVIGLVYLIPSRWALLKTVTAFTLAHSITLALSVLEVVRVPQGPVEAVIALSIVFLARELLLPAEQRSHLTGKRPWIMALLFGLLHGFGFAGALADIGLPRDQLATALLLFNVGIEVGQLMIIGALLVMLGALRWVGFRPSTAVLQGVAQKGGATIGKLASVDLVLIYGIGAPSRLLDHRPSAGRALGSHQKSRPDHSPSRFFDIEKSPFFNTLICMSELVASRLPSQRECGGR